MEKQLFTYFIIFLNQFNIINEHDTIKLFYGFYKINNCLIDDRDFFLYITDYLIDINKKRITKYILLIYVVNYLDDTYYKFFCQLNKNKLNLLKNNNYDMTNIINLKNLKSYSEIIDYYQKLKESLENIKKYLDSYEMLKQNSFLFSFTGQTEENKNIHKIEIINRFILLKNTLGLRIIQFILKKNKKIYEEMEFHEIEYLEQMRYNDLIKYSFSLFIRLNNNLDNIIEKDMEFNKYLKIILFTYVDKNMKENTDNKKDEITDKLYLKLKKKYIKS